MSWLALDASGGRAGIALLDAAGAVLQKQYAPLRPGLIETLPLLLRDMAAGQTITHVAACIGPGSFTGLRTSLALAQGFAAASGATLWGVPGFSAYAQGFPQLHRPLWVALRARKGRLFLLRGDAAEAFADADLPAPAEPIALAGDAAPEAAALLAARGKDVLLTNARLLDPAWVGRAAQAQYAAGLPPHLAQPAYIDPPEAKLPAGGLRPAPL